jgi:hypothetical protein
MTHHNPSRGRRTQRRAAQRQTTQETPAQAPAAPVKHLQVPDHIRALTDKPEDNRG